MTSRPDHCLSAVNRSLILNLCKFHRLQEVHTGRLKEVKGLVFLFYVRSYHGMVIANSPNFTPIVIVSNLEIVPYDAASTCKQDNMSSYLSYIRCCDEERHKRSIQDEKCNTF